AAQGRFVSEAFMEKRIASTQRDVQQKYEALLTHHRDLELEYAERLVVVMHERDELHAQQKRAQEVEHSNQLRASIQSYNAQIESYKDRVTDLEQQVKEAEDRTETFRLLVADAHAMNERLQQQSQLCGWWWRALLCCQCCERSQTLPL
ncbi:MAG TPA: hypothetical protein VLG71_02110, partial [Candidatus Limnocylindria bacterium]|nr:hypothetical protein [Candidatus Limnocylindria bacterium]